MFCGLVRYFSDKYSNGGWYLNDQKLTNYMYGSSNSDESNQLYFIDLDGVCTFYDVNAEDPESLSYHRNYIFYLALNNLMSMMIMVEQRLNGNRFTRARKRFIEFLEMVPEPDPSHYSPQVMWLKKDLAE